MNNYSKYDEVRLFKQYHKGCIDARRIIIERNRELVGHIAKKYTGKNSNYSSLKFDDMVSCGTIGMIKAVDTFDLSKKIRFSTYAGRCIENEILMLLRKEKKHIQNCSLDEVISTDHNGNELRLYDVVKVIDQGIEQVHTDAVFAEVMKAAKKLNQKEQKILRLRYFDGRLQHEIAKIFGNSQSCVSRVERKLLKKLRSSIS